MKKNIIEIIIAFLLLFILIGLPLAISHNSPWNNHSKIRTINITAVAAQGIFTEDVVNGANYWYKKFSRANIILVKNEKVILRFTSVDVTHSFYVPEANIGPITIEAGHFYDVHYTPKVSGKFTYYCTSVCGHCHNYMRGNFVILEKTDFNNPQIVKSFLRDTIRPTCCIEKSLTELRTNSFITNGKILFNDKGCFLCHGIDGKGGIINPNYALTFVPTLNTLADKLKLNDKEEADSIIKYLERGENLQKLDENPPFSSFNRFFAQYNSIINKIMNGSPIVQRLDTNSFDPPLFMPSWEHHLSKKQINSVIAYLINCYDWDKD